MQMAAKKPGRAGSQEAKETTEAQAADTGANGTGAAVGGTGARAKGARKTASAGAGSGAEAGGSESASGTPSDGGTTGKRSTSDTEAKPSAGGATRARKTATKSAAKSATKSASKRAGSAQGGTTARQAAGGASGGDELRNNLRAFLSHHPHGWGHSDWEGLLNHLRQSGFDASDEARVGSELEKERVVYTLETSGVSGLSGSKARSVADRFGSVHELRQASVDDIAGIKGINRSQAEKIHEAVR
jgi:hypothetical protein